MGLASASGALGQGPPPCDLFDAPPFVAAVVWGFSIAGRGSHPRSHTPGCEVSALFRRKWLSAVMGMADPPEPSEPVDPVDAHIRWPRTRTTTACGCARARGLFFICYQKDTRTRFVPLQRKLA